ncbi:MAG: 50S ribosomal protein L18 [Candidatus Omnitrophica bacterium]|nr:50S ribosomal protein L18 [Candidatus Omnitrophota bacterium]MBI5145463.1 50S ribosomal protein L18 [Candidatus Omnitrophota bacterium]
MKNKKELSRLKRHKRIKLHIQGQAHKPRLVIRRSLKNIFAQVIDDVNNKILFSFSSANPEVKQSIPGRGNIKSAEAFGERFARELKEKGINEIIFDRAGYLYHGRVKAFAESLRKGGLKF